MSRANIGLASPIFAPIRCAVYTRKSTDEGLEKQFNSLDAQRESGEAFIRSQQHEGWICMPDRYDDGGFTGGNMERPALRRLIADIEAGRIDCVVVYKVDRLSRSLLDFARMMETFDSHKISFVSVTQQFNTTHSMGRLTLNILLSFAQFEREIISERTRDKIAAMRRKGKWAGGHPLLGYDVDPRGFRLIVNEDEAVRVRAIFELYLLNESLLATVGELQRRGWRNKHWTTRTGGERGGLGFNKATLYKLLTNVAYMGKVRYKTEVHEGEHGALIDAEIWQRVQAVLSHNGRTGGAAVRNKFGALLKGIFRCAACGRAMSPTHATKNANTRYRYYVCTSAQKLGWHTCPSKSIPADEIERFVVEQIRSISRNPDGSRDAIARLETHSPTNLAALEAEQSSLERKLSRRDVRIRKLLAQLVPGAQFTTTGERTADLQERVAEIERRAAAGRERLREVGRRVIEEREQAQVTAVFEPAWGSLAPLERSRVVQSFVKQVDYDGATGKLVIAFHAAGVKSLVGEREAADTSGGANGPLAIETKIHFERRSRGGRKRVQAGEPAELQSQTLDRVPRVAHYMGLAVRFDDLIASGVASNYADLARLHGVSRARMTQIMNLRLLAPDLQEALLFLRCVEAGRDPIHLEQLQRIALTADWQQQRRFWAELTAPGESRRENV